MNRKIYIFLLIPLFLSFLPGRTKRNHLAEMDLKGKVKTLKEASYETRQISGKTAKGNTIGWAHFYSFNEEGFKTEENLAYIDGSEPTRAVYSYDKDWVRTEVNTFYPDGRPELKVTAKYSRKGFETERTVTDVGGGDNNWKTLYEYNRSGNKTLEEIVRKGILTSKIHYKYDRKGKLVETIQLKPDGSVDVTKTYTYDENGNNTGMTETSADSVTIVHTYTYEFDVNNNWMTQTDFVNNKAVMITERDITYY